MLGKNFVVNIRPLCILTYSCISVNVLFVNDLSYSTCVKY